MSRPPGSHAPVFWQMWRWIAQPFDFLEQCAQTYGDCFSLALSTQFPPMVVLNTPEVLQQLLSDDKNPSGLCGED